MRQSYFNKEQKRKMRKRFAWVSYEVLEDEDLTSSDKVVYMVLSRFADNETQECYPSFGKIRKLSGLTDTTISTSIKHLEEKEYIEVSRNAGKVNMYQLNEPPKKLDYSKRIGTTTQKEEKLPPKNNSTNNTNSNNTNINNTQSCDKSREGTKSKLKEELPFSCEQELNKLVDSPRRDLHIIGIYWKYKNFKFENRKQFEVSLKRELKPVQNLIPYQDDRIFEVIDYLDEKNFKWTLETVFKYINEDLDELKAKEKYK
ncbi:MAG TPA: helix-turn-helix domain-containing protein [Candidatus Paceibacterota bacterium]|nr:helix-turn-helix domain-containing protein [Candidatus Paceibacterota bacterium]